MNISFTGAHSTGKSTLLAKCRDVYGNRFEYVPEVTRSLARKGIKINEEGNNLTQLLVLNSHIENSLLDDAVLDRCIIDGCVYTRYLCDQGKVDAWVFEYACNVHNTIIGKLDVIFYTDADIPLVADGQRSVNVKFREGIVRLFEDHIKGLQSSPSFKGKVVRLSGNVDERMNIISKVIN